LRHDDAVAGNPRTEKDKLYLMDSELIRRLGVPERAFRAILPALNRNTISRENSRFSVEGATGPP
jgi:hypothetical protein